MTKKTAAILERLNKTYGLAAEPTLYYSNPHELLVATMLSAQCTDERVNMVTKELFRKFGTPYEVAYPCLPASLKRKMAEWKKRSAGRKEKVLIVHEQFAANAAREELEKDGSPDWEIHTGTFFRFFPEYGRNGDLVFAGEEDFAEKLEKGNYTLLIADEVFHRFLKEDPPAGFIPFTHFAVSGRLEEE